MSGHGLYIHIPFCKRKCLYCDFVSYAGKEELIESYVEALITEIQSSPLSSDYRRNSFPSPSKMERGAESEGRGGVRTIFFGGGTPTLLEPKHIALILQNVGTTFMVVQDNRTGTSPVPTLEITIEANPGTVNLSKLKALRSLGINRLSLGAQSFDDNMLKMLGRIHTAKEIYEAYDNARKAGFDNINLDLIFALPGQTLEQWKADLSAAIHLTSNHLSIYNLQIEENTPFAGQGLRKLSDEEELAMYEYTIETLTANGYKHYEISNFAKPGFECKHNLNYWLNGNYIGIGAGAHSHWNGKRWANPDSIEEYIKSTNNLRLTTYDSHSITDQRDTLIMGLRLLDGIGISKFSGFEKEVEILIKERLLEQSGNNYRLTRQGLYLANEVFRRFV